MDDFQYIGIIVSAVITLGGFVTLILKFTQPINDLRLAIQKLSDSIDMIRLSSDRQEEILNNHDKLLTTLDGRVGRIETKIEMYHEKEGA